MAPIKVGLLGLGLAETGIVGRWGVAGHLRSIEGLPDLYEIVAVANSSVESAQKSIDAHKLPKTTKAYGNPEDIAADPNVELVVVSVDVRKHYQLALPALKHKKSIFVEWPLGANLAQAEELTRLAAKNGVRNMVGVQGRGEPILQKAKELLASGKIGTVHSSVVSVCTSAFSTDGWFKGGEWLLEFNSGANEFTVFEGHFLDSFTYLLGDFVDLHAIMNSHFKTLPIIDMSTGQLANPAAPYTAPDHVFIQGTLENDAVASITFRKAKSPADDVGFRWIITGSKGEISITTEKDGGWQFGDASQRTLTLKVGKEEAEKIDFLAGDDSKAAKVPEPGTNTARQYEAFATKGAEIATFEDALKNHRLLDRIAKAAGWDFQRGEL